MIKEVKSEEASSWWKPQADNIKYDDYKPDKKKEEAAKQYTRVQIEEDDEEEDNIGKKLENTTADLKNAEA